MLRKKYMTFYIKFAKDSAMEVFFRKVKTFLGNFISSSIHLLVIFNKQSNLNLKQLTN